MMDTVLNPQFLHRALDHIEEVQITMMERFLTAAEGAIDLVFLSDDMGSQQSLLISPASFDEFLFPRISRWCDMIHSFGAKVFFHTVERVNRSSLD
jgi:uroporphyrinogen decarboxylase